MSTVRSIALKTSKGFTLIEILVAMALFSVIAVMTVSAYLAIVAANAEAQASATASNSLSFAIESMTRSIRTGTAYSCGAVPNAGNCTAGGSAFTFTDESGQTVTYSLSGAQIKRQVAGNPADIVSDTSITITALLFYVDGVGADSKQPIVRIAISGTIPGGRKITTIPFSIETLAIMRKIDS